MTIAIPRAAQDRLRALRLWHWREAIRMRIDQHTLEDYVASAVFPDPYAARAKSAERQADQHIKFVQTLNDFFPVGDNAESDAIG